MNKRGICLLLIIGICTFAFRVLPGPEIIDDAYITYRIADNLANGNGFVYNVGERLQSSTTPAYVLLLSLMARLGADLCMVSFLMNAVFCAFTGMMLFFIAMKLLKSMIASFACVALFIVSPGNIIYSVSGMETAFFECMIVMTCTAYLCKRDGLAALLAGFLPLIRPEGFVVAGIVGLGLVIAKRQRVWKFALVAMLPLILWIVWATLYFGTPIPHSVSEKQRFFTDPSFAVGFSGFLRQWVYHYYSLFWGQPISFHGIRNTRYFVMLLGGGPFAAGYGYFLFQAVRDCSRRMVLAFTPGLFALALILGQAGLPFPWYFIPTSGLFISISLAGLYALAVNVGNRFKLSTGTTAYLLLVCILAIVMQHIVFRYALRPRFMPLALYEHVPQHREPVYIEAAKWMASQSVDSTNLVLCSEVGAIGYFCPYKVWDQHLTTPPEITDRGAALVERYRPRYITYMGLYSPVKELENQPDTVSIRGVNYVKAFCVNENHASSYAKRHNVLIYERFVNPN